MCVISEVIECICDNIRYARLPLPSGCRLGRGGHRAAWGAVLALHHGVGAVLHIADSGSGAVPLFGSLAGGTGVVQVETNAMCPAIIGDGSTGWHGEHRGKSGSHQGHVRWGRIDSQGSIGDGCNRSNCIGMMVASLHSGGGFGMTVVLQF